MNKEMFVKRSGRSMPIAAAALLIAAAMGLSACGALRSAGSPPPDFTALESDRRVLYEPGAGELAQRVAAALPAALMRVEQEHGRPFTGPVEVYVCATEARFNALTNSSDGSRGAVTRKLYLSGLLNKPELFDSVPVVLIHELSHLHMLQYLGLHAYHANIPAWFHEGFAEIVSLGCGGDAVQECDAAGAILAGKHLRPDPAGSAFIIKEADDYGLERAMFYRQSGMFVGYLKKRDEAAFAKFISALENGYGFGSSFRRLFGITLDDAWKEFEKDLKMKYP